MTGQRTIFLESQLLKSLHNTRHRYKNKYCIVKPKEFHGFHVSTCVLNVAYHHLLTSFSEINKQTTSTTTRLSDNINKKCKYQNIICCCHNGR